MMSTLGDEGENSFVAFSLFHLSKWLSWSSLISSLFFVYSTFRLRHTTCRVWARNRTSFEWKQCQRHSSRQVDVFAVITPTNEHIFNEQKLFSLCLRREGKSSTSTVPRLSTYLKYFSLSLSHCLNYENVEVELFTYFRIMNWNFHVNQLSDIPNSVPFHSNAVFFCLLTELIMFPEFSASSRAVLVQITPVLGVLVGIVLTLILLAVCIVVFVKFKGNKVSW